MNKIYTAEYILEPHTAQYNESYEQEAQNKLFRLFMADCDYDKRYIISITKTMVRERYYTTRVTLRLEVTDV